MLWGLILFCVSVFLISWFNYMQHNYWHIMTMPAKIFVFALPIFVWVITCIVWSIVLLY